MALLDTDFRYVVVNDRLAAIHGTSAAEARGRRVREQVPALWPSIEPHLVRVRQTGVAVSDVEITGCTRANPGEPRRWLASYSPVRGADGRVSGFLEAVEDVTERRRAAENARRALSLLESALESTADGILVVDRQGRIVRHNQKFVRMWLIPPGLLAAGDDAGAIAFVLDQLRDPDAFLEGVRALYAEPEAESLEVVELKDGRVFERYSQPQRMGDEVVGRVWSFRDVTPRRRAEDRLAESERKLRTILESEPECVKLVGPDGLLLAMNPAGLAMVDAPSADAVVGHRVLELVSPEHHGVYRALHEAVLAGESRSATFEMVSLKGARRWVESHACPLRDAEGRIVAQLAVTRDITARKESEAELLRHREHLEELVAERTRELAAANRGLETFGYSVSHDLRAPLRSIDGFAQILLEDHADRLDPVARSHLARIRAASQRMAGLIEDLLRLSRVSLTEFHPENVDLSALVHEIGAALRDAAPDRRVELVVQEGVEVRGDPRLLRILMENLLGNAWKYTSRHPTAHIAFLVEEEGGRRVFRVRDDGAGFDMAHSAQLFEPFRRLHGAEFEGTGIGLATARRVVERHGGRVWAEGEVERGATVSFTLGAPPLP